MRTVFNTEKVAHDVELSDRAVNGHVLFIEIHPNHARSRQRLDNLDELGGVGVGDAPRAASAGLGRHGERRRQRAADSER